MGMLDGRVAFVTGGASGMGRASSLRFAAEGARVVVADIQEAAGQAVVDEIEAAGGEAVFHRTDVTSEDDVAGLVARAVGEFGALHIAYSNAGVGGPDGFEDAAVAELDHAWAVNLRAAVLAAKHALPAVRKAGGGSLLMTSSGTAIRGRVGNEVYSALKAGVTNFTATLAQSVAADGIRVNAIAPGWIRTPMMEAAVPGREEELARVLPLIQPLARQGTPADIAAAALFLVSDEARFITGVTLPVDGGLLTIAPERPEGAAAIAELFASTSARR